MEIVRTRQFDRDVERIGASDSDVAALMEELRSDPAMGDRIRGLPGVRKVRFALPSRRIGKSGGGRAIYVLAVSRLRLILLLAYQKNEQEDLSSAQRKAVLKFVEALGDRP